jgi:hypothetical protein
MNGGSKMTIKYDFKQEWKKRRDQLSKLSKEALQVAKKGEKEFFELSRKTKIHVDSTALTLKKEHLYYLIGKEYVNTQGTDKSTSKLMKFVSELKKANRQQLALKRRLKMVQK